MRWGCWLVDRDVTVNFIGCFQEGHGHQQPEQQGWGGCQPHCPAPEEDQGAQCKSPNSLHPKPYILKKFYHFLLLIINIPLRITINFVTSLNAITAMISLHNIS